VEVDGERLPIANVAQLQASPSPVLFLSRGVHAVRFRPGERPVEVVITEHLSDTYRDMQQFFDVHGEIRTEELTSRGARAMDVHYAPFLLNFLGASYAARDEWDAAERKFRRALHVNPMFSPAHLNLAHCLMRREQLEDAIREVQLAEAFNVGNVFGIASGISSFRRQINLSLDRPDVIEFTTALYVSTEPTSVEDERIVALMQGISKYAVRAEERGKILNNLAVHFADTGRPELALEYFRGALDVVKTAGPERFTLARQVLSHMESTCQEAGFTEAEEYGAMQALVRP
jgi:tetratricopeptide (TPR) repeat protein